MTFNMSRMINSCDMLFVIDV